MTSINRGDWQGNLGRGLSLRELEFTLHVASGMTDKQIARVAGIAPDTVRKRVYSAMFKLGANRRAQLVAEAMRRAIITPLALILTLICISASNATGTDIERPYRASRIQGSRGGRREDPINNLFQV